jgi:FixJ family two-component response regulator
LPKPASISIIEDDDLVREALESLIRSLGYDAETFASAEDYLNRGRIAETRCLITDLHMPGMTGLDLHNRLIAAGHRIPTIFMSGYSEGPLYASAIKAGAAGFFEKPIDIDRFVQCLEKALAG